jgi:hypothetical protein
VAVRFGVTVGEGVIVGVAVCVAVAVGSGVSVGAFVGTGEDVGWMGAFPQADNNKTSAKAIIRTERKFLCFIFFSLLERMIEMDIFILRFHNCQFNRVNRQ